MIRRFMMIASAVALGACTMTDMAEDETMADAEVAAAAEQNVVQTAMAADNLSTLVTAVQAADLADTLSGPGPFTVFAPTDAAFQALPPGVLDQLLLPENQPRLRALLAYHVLPGEVMSADIAGQQLAAATAQGSPVQIDAAGSGVRVDNANVIAADIDASNGVVHVIDRVLVPTTPPPAPAS